MKATHSLGRTATYYMERWHLIMGHSTGDSLKEGEGECETGRETLLTVEGVAG